MLGEGDVNAKFKFGGKPLAISIVPDLVVPRETLTMKAFSPFAEVR